MTREEYQLWAEHPQTKQFHQYLIDYRAQLMDRWANGGLVGDDSLMAIARAQMAEEIVNLDDDSISEFYRGHNSQIPLEVQQQTQVEEINAD